MKIASYGKRRRSRVAKRVQKALGPLVAAGGSLAALPAGALELGEATVESHLGQPLRASIAYALAPNEQISDTCVSVGRMSSAAGLPGIGRATIKITDRAIILTGQSALREPVVSARLVVDCPYTANLAREYMMFIDPASPAFETAPARPQTAVRAQPASVTQATSTTRSAPARGPIGPATRYRVQPGDSLSEIVQRIENRPIGLWPAVNAIFAANPDAFMDNDPNKLKAGSWLDIPSFDGTEPVVAATAPQPTADAAKPGLYEPIADNAASPGETVEPAANPAAVETPEPVVADTPSVADTGTAAGVDAARDATDDLRPGDIILDTELAGPETTASSPNVATAVIDNSGTSEVSGRSWSMWWAGAGIAALLALVLFGRRLKDGPAPADESYADDTETAHNYEDEYDLDDDSPTTENLALDADLLVGTGLAESTDMEVAEDFGFAATTNVDIELPPEPSTPTMQTDIIPPVLAEESSILESEILPDDDDYDMSVIVDATKMPQPEDVTERDLQAVEVEPLDDTDTTDSYTIEREADFGMLEQDYEDELTATQALNREIQRAAEELAERVEQAEGDTAEMPLATVTELEVTAQLPGAGEATDQPDATAEHEAVDDDDDTAKMEAEGGSRAG